MESALYFSGYLLLFLYEVVWKELCLKKKYEKVLPYEMWLNVSMQ